MVRDERQDDRPALWVEEMKAMRQQLAEVEQERDRARASAEHWRLLYAAEAEQRRSEAKLHQQQLQARVSQQQAQPQAAALEGDRSARQRIALQVEAVSPGELPEKLTVTLLEVERLHREVHRLQEELHAEREEGDRTRKNLIAALGDAVGVARSCAADREREPAPPAQLPSFPT